MTLGPDRFTRARWLLLEAADKGGGGGSDSKSDTDSKTDDKSDDDKGTKPDDDKGSGTKQKAVTVEIEGVTYVVQDHVNELVGRARTEGKNAGKQEKESELKQAELAEQGNYKELYETEKGKVTDLERRLADLEFADLKRKVGAKHKLSQKLIDRLQGTTEAELEADAKDLAKEFGTGEDTDKKKEDKKPPVRTEGTGSYRRSTTSDESKKPDDNSRRKSGTFAFVQQGDVNRWGETK